MSASTSAGANAVIEAVTEAVGGSSASKLRNVTMNGALAMALGMILTFGTMAQKSFNEMLANQKEQNSNIVVLFRETLAIQQKQADSISRLVQGHEETMRSNEAIRAALGLPRLPAQPDHPGGE